MACATFLYPSPLHYKIVPEMVYAEQSTIMFGTDSFLPAMPARATRWISSRCATFSPGRKRAAGNARRLHGAFQEADLRGLWRDRDRSRAGAEHMGAPREGSVGRLLPGIEARLEPVPGIEEGGRLLVRGPNVMLGYLRAEAPGVLQPPPDGWYDTGDIVTIDGDGFVTIKGRAKRFAKIGGEMVSLAAAEALATAVWPDAAHAVSRCRMRARARSCCW